MKKELSEVERLDLAARALVSAIANTYGRVSLAVLSFVALLIAIEGAVSFRETLILCIFAVTAAIVTASLWLNWRYKIHVFAIFLFALGLNLFLLENHSYGWISDFCYFLAFASGAYERWKSAGPFAAVQRQGWEKERSQVYEWLQKLNGAERADDVIEFSTRSFWRGHYTYRAIRTDRRWVVAKFKKSFNQQLAEYRIRELNDVNFTSLPDGKVKIDIGNSAPAEIDASPEMLGVVQRYLHG